jgi:Protein of unknown function (DUF1580)
MSIDLSRERGIPFSDVPKLACLPRRRGGRKVHVATVHRWASRGLRGVRLEFVQCGGTRVTTLEALMRFFDRLANLPAGPEPRRPAASRSRVERELDRLGL